MCTYSHVGVQLWGPSRRPISDEALREYCDRNYHQILPIIAEKVHQEKVQQEKLKAIKARLNFEEASHQSESGTPIRKRGLKERLGPKYVRSRSGSPEPRHGRSESPKKKGPERKAVFKRLEKGVFHRLGDKKKSVSVHSDDSRHCHIKTYDGSEDPEDHLMNFQSAAKTEPWAMPTWCHMFNSTLTGNARQKKCIKDPVEIHNIRQRDEESTKEFVQRVTTTFLRGDVTAFNRERKKSFSSWKQQEANQKQNFKTGGFRNQQRSERKQDRFTLLTKTPKEIFALDKEKFKAPPPMTTPVEKQNHAKFCEFHGEVGHNTDECMHLRKQIEEMLKAGKLSLLIKELKQKNGKEQPKVTKKGETSGKDKALAIIMVQPWERMARQKIMQSFSPNTEISFRPLDEDEGTEGPEISQDTLQNIA
ncbi:hypothetical protein Tco_0754325 [Tanacetum coccineum]